MIPAATFEGLFVRGLANDAALRQALLTAGFDASHMQVAYSEQVWNAALDAARALLFSTLTRQEADFQLGQKFNSGFLNTMVGSIIKVGLPVLGLKRVIARLPRTAPTAFPGVKVELLALDEQRAHVAMFHSPVTGDFARGVFFDAARLTNAKAQLTLTSSQSTASGHSFQLLATW